MTTTTSVFPEIGTDSVVKALAAMGLLALAPTVSAAPPRTEVIQQQINVGTYRINSYASNNSVIVGSSTQQNFNPTNYVELSSWAVDRPTTELEKIVGQFRRWATLETNWDGENANAPITNSLSQAQNFATLLTKEIPIPEPMLNSTGRAGLFWNLDNLYADLEFLSDEKIAYYIEKNKDKHKGVVTFNSEKMPAVLTTLLSI
jgi:hypothetical protein